MIVICTVTSSPLDVAAHERAVAHPAAGAVVSFAGVVRDHDEGREVTRLSYEAHPSASEILEQVAAEIAKDPSVYAVAISHRVGDLEIGDVALAAAVATAHRADAFALCARLVDTAKARLPIWKHQHYPTHPPTWTNSP